MSDYYISEIRPGDRRGRQMVKNLLLAEGIRPDKNLDYTCGMFDEEGNLLASGSCFGSTLRCLAVDGRHRGEGLMNEIVSHLVSVQTERGNMHLFLYTKCESAEFFADLGFYEIVRIPGQIVFMENRRRGFLSALEQWERETGGSRNSVPAEKTAAVIMNANPFTLGHQYLVEKAAAENELVHLFVVSEDAGPVPAPVRKELVRRGTAHLDHVVLHDCGPYLISSATFPAYFQKDEEAVVKSQASLDAAVFCQVAARLGIVTRYLGEEPVSVVTGIYNQILKEQLPAHGIECRIISRKRCPEEGMGAAANMSDSPLSPGKAPVISASAVRRALGEGRMDLVRKMVPPTTFDWFTGPEAAPVLDKIRKMYHYLPTSGSVKEELYNGRTGI